MTKSILLTFSLQNKLQRKGTLKGIYPLYTILLMALYLECKVLSIIKKHLPLSLDTHWESKSQIILMRKSSRKKSRELIGCKRDMIGPVLRLMTFINN